MGKYWIHFKELIMELIKTFSNEESFFSSKRIERCLVFLTMLTLTVVYVLKNEFKISSAELMIIVGGWLGYAGFNTVQIKKDIDKNKTE